MRSLCLTTIFFITLMLSPVSGAEWMSPKIAQERAKISHKPLLIYIFKEGCPACEDISKRFISLPFYAPALSEFELVQISADNASNILKIDATKTPSFYFVGEDMSEIAPPVEGSPADDGEFIDHLYKASLMYGRDKALRSQL